MKIPKNNELLLKIIHESIEHARSKIKPEEYVTRLECGLAKTILAFVVYAEQIDKFRGKKLLSQKEKIYEEILKTVSDLKEEGMEENYAQATRKVARKYKLSFDRLYSSFKKWRIKKDREHTRLLTKLISKTYLEDLTQILH